MKTNSREDSIQTNNEVNNGQKVSGNNMSLHKNTEENSQGSDPHIRTRYGRVVRKPDRLTYKTSLQLQTIHIYQYHHSYFASLEEGKCYEYNIVSDTHN